MVVREVPGEAVYRVTAPLVVVRCGPHGEYHHLYRDAYLPSAVDPRQIETLLTSGMIAPINEG